MLNRCESTSSASPAPSPLGAVLRSSPVELSSHLNFAAKGQAYFKVWELTENFRSNGEYLGSPTPGASAPALAISVSLEIDGLQPGSGPIHPTLMSPAQVACTFPLLESFCTEIPVCVAPRLWPNPSSLASLPLLRGLTPYPHYHHPFPGKEEAGKTWGRSIKWLSKECRQKTCSICGVALCTPIMSFPGSGPMHVDTCTLRVWSICQPVVNEVDHVPSTGLLSVRLKGTSDSAANAHGTCRYH